MISSSKQTCRKSRGALYIVDDDDSVRSALRRFFLFSGFNVGEFANVETFLGEARLDSVCCIVADISMPGISGLELPGLITERGLDIPIIFVTAFDSDEARREARRCGAARYFRKPVDGQALLDVIEWTLN